MKWLPWLDTSASDAFAREIAEEFARTLPPGPVHGTARDADHRAAHAIEVIGNRAAKYQATHPLGWYRKSKFMNTIEKCLVEKGHAPELVDRVVYAVVLRLSRLRTG